MKTATGGRFTQRYFGGACEITVARGFIEIAKIRNIKIICIGLHVDFQKVRQVRVCCYSVATGIKRYIRCQACVHPYARYFVLDGRYLDVIRCAECVVLTGKGKCRIV